MINSAVNKLDKGSFKLTINISKDEIATTREQVISEMVKEAQIPGFRKGSAPRDRVESTLDPKTVYEEILKRIVPRAYIESLKKHSLKPILNPKVELVKAIEGEDWEVSATSCEAPIVELGDYKAEIKKTLATDTLWTPDKGDPTKKVATDKDKQLNSIIDHLLAIITIEPAEMLVDEEVNHALSRLIDQTQSLGITVEQYLASTGKTAETLKEEYRESSRKNLKLEFLLNAIAKDLKIEISDKEIDAVIQAAGDENARHTLDNQTQRSMIRAILSRRQALDSIMKFA
ncbi:MAG: Trigger factor [Microgenomates group bacterium GW2011_GWA2_44_7]|nr:MAG: Trigger factor [Microgenomates group bacterium GW2011_GWA2_44_7]